ncbi:hypothetical protein [Qipengyuania pacifica]|uniref:hypothetical protein n=1 Tax=Qipengyuania pacifica TaxID=2860199 RepID=UPI001C9E1BB7|nr:hypothetical protein [Qipengyuania pacifica]MBY8335193.1 hypothetical protein [Qipengyuania pacifica]
MPNPRTPAAKARVTGAAAKNPQRHRDRKDPKGTPLGKPSAFLDEHGKSAWEGFKRELPWLMESDRAIIEVCAKVRGGLLSGEDVGVSKLNMLQTMLSKLGATPADRTRIAIADEDEEEDEFFDS